MRTGLFAGQSTASVTGNAGPGLSPRYSFPGAVGQSVTIVLNSPGNAANFSLTGESDGIVYKDFSNPSLNFSYVLPSGQTYIITVASPTTPVTFYMDVTLGDSGATPTPIGPTRITFMPGQTTASVSGNFSPGQTLQYIFAAGAGQNVTVQVNSIGNSANFSLQGVSNGIIYKPGNDAARQITIVSPMAQDYLIGVTAPAAVDYILQVTLPGALPPTPAPERINFAPGQSVAVVSGNLQPGAARQYVFSAAAGQNVRILLSSGVAGAGSFAVQGVSDAIVYKQPNQQNEWNFVAPVSQDYRITLTSAANTSYTLELTIPIPQPSTLTPAPTIPAGCTTNTIQNGDFSNNAFWIFGDSPVPGAFDSLTFHSPPRAVRLGVVPELGAIAQNRETFSSIRQTIEIPPYATTAQLRWWRYYRTEEPPMSQPGPGQDKQQVVLLNPDNSTAGVLRDTRQNDPQWVEEVADLTSFIGRPLLVYFNAFNDGNNLRTWQFLDDVSIVVCFPPMTPTPSITLYAAPQPSVVFQSVVTLVPPQAPIAAVISPAVEPMANPASASAPKDEPTVVLVLPPLSGEGSPPRTQGSWDAWRIIQVAGIMLGILGLIALTVWAIFFRKRDTTRP